MPSTVFDVKWCLVITAPCTACGSVPLYWWGHWNSGIVSNLPSCEVIRERFESFGGLGEINNRLLDLWGQNFCKLGKIPMNTRPMGITFGHCWAPDCQTQDKSMKLWMSNSQHTLTRSSPEYQPLLSFCSYTLNVGEGLTRITDKTQSSLFPGHKSMGPC